ncbi:MAG: hypothetical protein L3J96_00710 [Thermoplasmata archaeon]|nr:hypothetical protein [Thermoplasmata archaeon]
MSPPPGSLAGISTGGILTGHVGVTQARIAAAQATSGSIGAKVQALLGSASTSLGAHVRIPGGLISTLRGSSGGLLGGTGTTGPSGTPSSTTAGSSSTATDARPAGLAFK